MPTARAHRSFFAVATALLITLAVANSVSAAGWTRLKFIGPLGSRAIDLVEIIGGRLVAAYTNHNEYLIVRFSDDTGRTWAPAVRLGERQGEIYAVAGWGSSVDATWTSPDNQIKYVRSTDGGATFSAPVTLSLAGEIARRSDVARNGDTVAVVWMRESSFDDTATREFVVRESEDGGATFGEQIVLREIAPGASFLMPIVAVVGQTIFGRLWSEGEPARPAPVHRCRTELDAPDAHFAWLGRRRDDRDRWRQCLHRLREQG